MIFRKKKKQQVPDNSEMILTALMDIRRNVQSTNVIVDRMFQLMADNLKVQNEAFAVMRKYYEFEIESMTRMKLDAERIAPGKHDLIF